MSIVFDIPVPIRSRSLGEGWSWSRIFGATLLGIPLFQRGSMV